MTVSDNHHLLRVHDVIAESDDARSFVLAVPEDKRSLFTYRSGQFLTVCAPTDEGELERCYSLSSVHGVDEFLKVTVKRVPFGPVSNWMVDKVRPGDTLRVMRPAGLFVSRAPEMDLSLFAAGSGITPIVSLAKDRLLHNKGARVSLFYANRDERSVIFRTELAALAADFADRFTVTHWLESVQGLPSHKLIAAHARDLGSRENFICGPAPFMDAAAAALAQLGVDKHFVHLERFAFAAPKKQSPNAASQSSAQDEPDASLEVTLGGETRTLAWPADTLMLDVMEAAGLNPPYSCRAGACGACICQLDAGKVDMRHNELLDDADLAEGLVLACQAIPRSATVKVTF